MDKMIFETEDEMRAAMNGSDREQSMKVIDAILNDNIEIGAKPVDTEEVVDDIVENTVVDQSEPVVENVEEDLSVVLEEQNRKLKELYEQQVIDRENDFNAKLAERDEKIRIFEEQQAALKNAEPTGLNIDLDDEDPDLASTYSKNTRKLVEAELDALKSKISNPEIEAELASIRKKLADEEARGIQAEKDRNAEASRKKLYDDLTSFSKGKPGYELPIHVSAAVDEINSIKDKIGELFDTTEISEIEKIYRRVVKEDNVWSRAKRDELDKAGIVFPEYTKNYLNIVEVYELQKGKKFNTIAGVYEDVAVSLEDVYKISNFSNLVSRAGSNEAREIQKKLDQQQTSAVTLSNANTSNAAGESSYTIDDIIAASRMPVTELLKNKSKATQYVQYLKDEGMSIPSILKNF